MKTTVKKTTTKVVETPEKKSLREAFALWKTTSKQGVEYLSGTVSDDNKTKLVGFFNSKKKNPNEPDVRVYLQVEQGEASQEVASLWSNVDKNDKPYLSGTTNENERLVGFYGDENQEKRPFIRAYYSNEE